MGVGQEEAVPCCLYHLWWRHEAVLASDPSDLAAFSPGPVHRQPAPVGQTS